jgi:phage terminase large subunit-like protein
LQVLPRSCVKIWRRDSGELILFNGSRVRIFSADAPERLRGPQHHRLWCDELAAWPSREAFDQMLFGLRLGHDPRVVITTTPRNAPLIRELAAREGQDVYVTRGKTFENKAHLPPATLAHLRARYEGSRLGRQELDGEILEETEGSLWSRDMIEAARVANAPEMERVVIAIDPAMTGGSGSDETGIVAVGRGEDGLLYVLADWSCRQSRWLGAAGGFFIRRGGGRQRHRRSQCGRRRDGREDFANRRAADVF